MQKNNLNILSTRPLDENIIQQAKEKSIVIDCISFIQTEKIKSQFLQDQIDSLQQQRITAAFTSMNAVEAVKDYLSHQPEWNIYCIGQTTKELVADEFGVKSIKGTADNALLLAEEMILQHEREVVFFCGDQRRAELPDKLKEAGVLLRELTVYRTMQQSNKITKDYNGILFFSPSAVHSFFSTNKINSKTILFSIGSTTAEALQQYNTNPIIIADRPGKEALVYTMMDYFSNTQQQKN